MWSTQTVMLMEAINVTSSGTGSGMLCSPDDAILSLNMLTPPPPPHFKEAVPLSSFVCMLRPAPRMRRVCLSSSDVPRPHAASAIAATGEFQSGSSLSQAEHREQRGYVALPMFRRASSALVILRTKLGAESASQRSSGSSLTSRNSRQARWHSSQKDVHPHESTTIAVLTWHCRHSWAVLYALLPSSSSAVTAAAAAWPTLEFEKFLDNVASCAMSVVRRPMSASRIPRAADATGVVQGRGWLSVPLSSAWAPPAKPASVAPAAAPAPTSALSPLDVELNWQRSINSWEGATSGSAAAF